MYIYVNLYVKYMNCAWRYAFSVSDFELTCQIYEL